MHFSSSLIVLGAAFLFGVMADRKPLTPRDGGFHSDPHIQSRIEDYFNMIGDDNANKIRKTCYSQCEQETEGYDHCYLMCISTEARNIGVDPPPF
ncbi:hypothetical protein O0I10_011762 [Lichtheimia ornata]|uniref:Uncharacterized protein n=1 Tax=Lichtheimia ornata TaxID=688661 RepID=A0AAD7UUQ2_9FUNG|nr:uncharacterized protein O0I10_011762 [Lichtheimia ornata]KAJ8652616.1 hypothetical protein O0I10_011762 [Lichtheimia ornata]